MPESGEELKLVGGGEFFAVNSLMTHHHHGLTLRNLCKFSGGHEIRSIKFKVRLVRSGITPTNFSKNSTDIDEFVQTSPEFRGVYCRSPCFIA